MAKKNFTGKHILLLLLYLPGITKEKNEPIKGRTRIMKMIFLFDKEIRNNFEKDSDVENIQLPDFLPWKYGPFSKDIYDDIEFFINNAFIIYKTLNEEMSLAEIDEYENWMEDYSLEDKSELILNILNEERFSLSDKGVKFVEGEIYNRISANQEEILTNFKARLNEATLSAILRYVYKKYPEFSKESQIQDRYLY